MASALENIFGMDIPETTPTGMAAGSEESRFTEAKLIHFGSVI
jgi:hypothetical protein